MATNASSVQNQDEAWVIDAIERSIPPPSSAQIPKVPQVMSKKSDIYNEYYAPKVVSIGPYHHDDKKLESGERLKPIFTKALLSKSNMGLSINTLYKKLGEAKMVQELRNFYEEKSTDNFSDKEFTKMMLLDGCFILYYFLFVVRDESESCPELRSYQTLFIHKDLFLLENQIPFKVINEVINFLKVDTLEKVKSREIFTENVFVRPRTASKRFSCFRSGSTQSNQNSEQECSKFEPRHLLDLLHFTLTGTRSVDNNKREIAKRYTFRSINELVEVGVNFKPSRGMSLANVECYGPHWWSFSSDVKLPPITVDHTTKPLLLNLTAYEMCSDDKNRWVTSYICLLDSLVDEPEDVKALRKARVLDSSLGSDKEVADLFNEISSDLLPNRFAYLKVKNKIQKHLDDRGNTGLAQLKHEYIKSPWSFLALIGAVVALFLSGVQTYFTVWGPEGECDDLCTFLKINHHL